MRSRKNQKGFSLIEVLVSMALLGIVGVAFLAALTTASRTLITTDERETAKNIAEMQMEYIKGLPYSNSYSPRDMSDKYPGYTVVTTDGVIQTQSINDRPDNNIQKIELIIQHGNKTILTLDGFKTK